MFKAKAAAILGGYELLSCVGRGGNGTAWVVAGEPKRVIKILTNRTDARKYARFVDEIDAMNKCKDIDGVMPIIAAHAPMPADPTVPAWYVMPLADTLESLRENGITITESVAACRDFALTLSGMHKIGISHRDLKPENLFRIEGKWMIGDFGLADFSQKLAITEGGERVGPIFYSAPEMFNSPGISDGRAADVFSLAKVLWVLIAGQKYPLPGRLDSQIESTRASSYVDNSQVVVLDKLLECATALNPAVRPTAEEFANELTGWLDGGATTNGGRRLTGIDLSDYVSKPEYLAPQLAQQRHDRSVAESAEFDGLCQIFLSKFAEVIDGIYRQFNSLGPQVAAGKTMQHAGPSHLHCVIGDIGPDAGSAIYVWQYVASMSMRSRSGATTYRIHCGISINHPGFVPELGGWCAVKNAMSVIGAGFYLEDCTLQSDDRFQCRWSDTSTILLGGANENELINRLSVGIEKNFRPFFAACGDYAQAR